VRARLVATASTGAGPIERVAEAVMALLDARGTP